MKLSEIPPFITAPILLGLHWWTGAEQWLYVFGALSVFTTVICVAALSALWVSWHSGETDRVDPTNYPKPSKGRSWVGAVYQLGVTAYLLWSGSYIATTLYLIGVSVSWLLTYTWSTLREQREAEIAWASDTLRRRVETAEALERERRDIAG